jgi:uncharacterized protein (TIGR03083 family)
MDDAEVWAAVDRRRSALVNVLAGLTEQQWDTPSLCEGWTVRDVAAHLTMPLLTTPQLLALALRHPGGTNRLIRDGSRALARRYEPREIVGRLSQLVGRHRHLMGLTCREALIDVIGHSFDIGVPLGLELGIPPVEIAEAADRVVSYGGRGNAKVFRLLPLEGYRLVATDLVWTTGTGPEVAAPMADLFLLLTGRRARLGELRGAGADALRDAIAA